MKKAALIATILLSLGGAGVGGLMTWHHDTQLYGTEEVKGELIGCTESATVNCDIVNTSEWSELGGVPIATLAIPFYATMAILAWLALKERKSTGLLLVGGIFSAGLSGFLYHISTTELHYVCAWCLRLYGVNLGLLLAALLARPALPDGKTFGTGVGAFIALTLLSVGAERGYRTSIGGGELGKGSIAQLTQDPKGKLRPIQVAVTTEDNRPATFTLEADDAWKGNLNAKVVVVEFADLECGYCKRASSEMEKLYEHYGDRVLFVFKHYPMNPTCNPGVKNNKHRYACRAAHAAVCAQRQGKFWAFHDLTYKNQHQLGDDYLRSYAVQVGVDPAQFDSCMQDRSVDEVVKGDATAGASLDIHGTPRIFINGKLYRSGSSAQAMAQAIEAALGTSAADIAKNAAELKGVGNAAVAAIPENVSPMQTVNAGDHSFKIDTFEAGIQDGKATVGKHQIPAIRSSWYSAKAACEAAGKRLCTEQEWVSACQGAPALDDNKNGEFADDMIEGTAYPYGDYHDDNRCWDAKERDTFRPVYTGEMPGCVTANGAYDMTGNVEEWVGDSPEHAVLLGGAWDTTEDHARCYRRNDTFGAGYASPRTGFRCCAEVTK